jgi:hypothetical protein
MRFGVMYEKTIMAIVWKLPRRLVYWCAIRLIANATTGFYGDQNVPDLSAMVALKRWEWVKGHC